MKKRFSIFLSFVSLLISILAIVLSFADIETNKLEFNTTSFLSVIGTIITTLGFVFGIYFALLAVNAYGDIKKIEEQAEIIEAVKINMEKKAETIEEYFIKIQNLVQEAENNNTCIKEKAEETQKLAKKTEDIKSTVDKQVVTIEDLVKKAENSNDSIGSILNFHTNNYMETIDYQMAFELYLMNSFYKMSSLNKESKNHLKLLDDYKKLRERLILTRARMSYNVPQLEIKKRKQFLIELGGLGDETDLLHLKKIIESENETDDFKEITKITIQNIKDRLQKKSRG